MWGLRAGLGGEPFVEGNAEGEELFLCAIFSGHGVDHLDVELGVFERFAVELADVVEEVAGEGAVGIDGGGIEAEVSVVFGDLLVDGLVVEGDGRERHRQGNLPALGALCGEEAALDVVVGGGGDDVVVGGDELDAGLVERDGGVAVVGEDDADGDEAVLHVGKAEEVAVPGIVAGVRGDGELLFGVGIEGGVLVRGFSRGSLLVGSEGRSREQACSGYQKDRDIREWVGLHGQVDYDLRWRTR